jgi:poly(3-hydroxybutyrate) depolymerase
MGTRRGSAFSLLAVGMCLATASCGGGNELQHPNNGAAGTGSGAAGTGSGAAGTGAAGDGSTGAAGDTGSSGTAGTSSSGSGGSGAGGVTGGAGSTGTAGGSGTTGAAGSVGSTGAAGTGGGGTNPNLPSGPSAGCTMPPKDNPGGFVHHTIAVTGVDPNVKAATAGGSWTMRDYFIRLPNGYDPAKPYPLLFGGGGCGGSLVSNGNGAFANSNANSGAIQIGMSYLWPQGGGPCFNDNNANTPDLPYFDAMLKEIEANYCVDRGKVFVGGYSSGGWESYMLGLARGGIVRGISPAAGGLRMSRPPGSNIPIAALLLTGANDTANPATGATGSDAAMNLILQINGCQGTDTVAWEVPCKSCGCKRYTGCPAAYPVVRCRPGPPNDGHVDGGGDFRAAIWQTWMSLPNP